MRPTTFKKGALALVDSHGRHIHKLRISLLDACNLQCNYCMPEQKTFTPPHHYPSAEELVSIIEKLCTFGIDELRLTGGEPLLRNDIPVFLKRLGKLPLKKFGITTNALLLHRYLDVIEENGCHHLNISLDSLEQKTFHQITGSPKLGKTIDNLLAAHARGLQVKINTVVMRGINDHEVEQFLSFGQQYGIEVRFLEVMNIGVVRKNFDNWFIPADAIIQRLKRNWQLTTIPTTVDATAFNLRATPINESESVDGQSVKVGFIASQSQPFCGGCSRLRIGPDGRLRPCLFKSDGPSLRDVPLEAFPTLLKNLLALKPTERPLEMPQPMYQIGG